VAGWTTYFGIFHGSSFYDGTLQFMTNARAFNVNKPIISTEFGVWSGENFTGVEYQVKVLDSTFAAFRGFTIRDQNGALQKNGSLVGTIWWCIFDWHSSQHLGGFQSMGVYRMDHLTPKPSIADRLAQTYKPYYDSMELATGIADVDAPAPRSFSLEANYPNPFNPSTTIRYSLPTSGTVLLRVYDMLGREVAVLADEEQNAGEHAVVWTASELPSGVYLCTLTSGGSRATLKMVLAK
jgi:beta-glucuronidase